jgi:hypothetical protein
MDTYTRIVLTVIAAALVVIALQGFGSPIPVAHAADRLDCRIDGPIEVKGLTDELRIRIGSPVEIKQSHSEAGSSSSYPLYIKSTD